MARGLRGVRDDLSELGRHLLDIACFLHPLLNPAHTDSPPPTPTGPGRHRLRAARRSPSPHPPSSPSLLAGILSDLAEIGGSFRGGFSRAAAPSSPPAPAPAAAVEAQQAAAASPPSSDSAADQIAVDVVGAARALAARPEAWIDFPVLALDEDSVISNIQRDHMESIEKLVPDLASLRGRLCPSYMNEDIFWKIYFRLLESNIIEHSSEKLAPDLCNALSLTKQKKQQAAQEGKMKKLSRRGKKVADESSHTLEIPQANLDSENQPHNDDVNIELRHVFDEFSPSEVDDGIKGKEPIAEGSYGSVYQTNIRGTTVAVKILMKQHGSKAKKDFKSEIEILKTIQHENLVTLLGACMEKWALIFEFCPKGTLGDRLFPPTTTSSSSSSNNNSSNSRRRSSGTLQDWKPLSWEERVRAARGICSGLEFLHSLRIAHCDLKPNNILFDAKDVCKICDFGLMRRLRLTRDTATPVHYTGRFGTPSYWDPEFIQNKKGKLTRKSDVYALGIILLQLVTGKPAAGLRDWVSNKVREQAGIGDTEKCQQLVDPEILDDLKATSKKEDALKMIDLGQQCSSDTRKQRPDVATVCSVIESMLNAG